MTTEASPSMEQQPAEKTHAWNFVFTCPSEKLLRFFQFSSVISDECILEITREGWGITTVDRAHISMAVSRFALQNFDDYRIGADESSFKIYLPLNEVSGAIKRVASLAGKKAQMKFSVSVDGSQGLVFTTYVVESEGVTERFRTNASVESLPNPKVPQLADYPLRVFMDWKKLQKCLKAASNVAETVRFFREGGKLRLRAGKNEDDTQLLLTLAGIQNEGRDGYGSTFPSDYLRLIAGAGDFDRVTIKVGNEFPLVLEFDCGWMNGTILLAPRQEDA